MQSNFFDLDNRYAQLIKDPLVSINQIIDFSMFEPLLLQIDNKARKSKAGRPVTNRTLMFKMLILQKLYNLSDEQTEFQSKDRLSFMRFLNLSLSGTVPDANTLRMFREQLISAQLIEPLFNLFNIAITCVGARLTSGQMVDATFVHAPKQRNSRDENEIIKNGGIPEDWSDNKAAQKDIDASWTKKNNTTYYGYKNHVNVDVKTKIITTYAVSTASVHDSVILEELVQEATSENEGFYGDSAYHSAETTVLLHEKVLLDHTNERAYRNKPLTIMQEHMNRIRSATRSRVEHIFGAMVNSMGGKFIRTIGIKRAKAAIGLTNLVYNIKRTEFLIRSKQFDFSRINASDVWEMA
jgi:IS5 family transposase